ncbi:class I SAM-dependent methyltransferase [Rhodovarius lipocyclicus]|uniref:class I SAM-dependent methyltransferase n=1 Tax=Rhodovarius lipocyclicus TaxID=268410 RepID=UPI00135BA261|nr:class I SAM-dependent methyltransferase [Rhodovarius lipocyclicus]
MTGTIERSRYQDYMRAAEGVQGWFSDMSAALFDAFLSLQGGRTGPGDMLEIGVAYGRSALMMGMQLRLDATLRLVDVGQALMDQSVELITPHCEGRIEPTLQFSEALPPDSLPALGTRFVHIDGEHGTWGVQNDLELADRVLATDGVVVLDDFFSETFVGVTIGALTWLAQHPGRFEMVLVGFNKAYLVRPRAARRYLEFIRDGLQPHLAACGQPPNTLLRTDDPRACGCFGLTLRQFDRDYVTREIASGLPESYLPGKYPV